ncbi:MAG: glycoside hydrolase family 127 protein [Candidatus Aminicenantes bacterium]|nr:glycoside hydrolase family 127 protein [Candidatus Aminicenantes bacterium]
MKTFFYVLGILAFLSSAFVVSSCQSRETGDYLIQPVPFTQVHLKDEFWSSRMETNRRVTIPYAFEQCEETGRIDNFRIAAGMKSGGFQSVYPFDDSDVYKIIQGASYSLQVHPDPDLEAYLDDLIAVIDKAQEEDGYLYTARTIDPDPPVMWCEGERWSNLYLGHELYNAGHLYEAAVAHYRATGKRSLLDIALKNADLVTDVFGPDKKRGAPGHQEIEIGLVKLYRVTGDQKYLDLAKFFLDERGHPDREKLYGRYSQDHKPVVEQEQAVGHAVRAVYMYSGMADVASLTGDSEYIQAIDRIWEDVVSQKLYITGGIGATGAGEAFGKPYQLPNVTAYAETCASIGNVFWNFRMFLLHGYARYIDVLERVLYNGLISGVSLDGDLFFYQNPLESFGEDERSTWFACACCPSNISRFMPSVPGYVLAAEKDRIYVNLFTSCVAQVKLPDQTVRIEQDTRYPWEEDVAITVFPEKEQRFSVQVRIPGWARNQPVPSGLYRFYEESDEQVSLKLNGKELALNLEKGYAVIDRKWKEGDQIKVHFPMPVRRVVSHQNVESNQGRVSLQRGPVVFCAEWADNSGLVSNLVLTDDVQLQSEFKPDLLKGLTVIKAEAGALFETQEGDVSRRKQEFTAIPYYSWAHRGKGEMAVWLARTEDKARPVPQPTIASQSQVTVSRGKDGFPIIDQREPMNSNDHTIPYLHWWPNKGTEEWVQLDFQKPATISGVEVYWFDDTGRGECRVPESWMVLVQKQGIWKSVRIQDDYGVDKDQYNQVTFEPVRTDSLRIVLQCRPEYSAGIMEIRIK